MRNFLVGVVLALAPLAMWMAGCRGSGRQAAFPGGPEVKQLARAGAPAGDRRPEIPSVIDPEVQYAPDSPTFARIRMVMDREAQLASRQPAAPGLFVLPRQDYHQAAETWPAYAEPREFASRPPAALSPAARGRRDDAWNPDFSAMAPASLPGLPDDFGMPERSAPLPAVDPGFPPEYIPGLFMGAEAAADAPLPFEPLSLGPPSRGEAAGPEPSALPPRLSSASFDTVALADLSAALDAPRPGAPEPARPAGFMNTTPAAEPLAERMAALLAADDVAAALAPLPILAEPSPAALADLAGELQNRDKAAGVTPARPRDMVAALDSLHARDEAPAAPERRRDLPGGNRFLREFWNNDREEEPAAVPGPGNSLAESGKNREARDSSGRRDDSAFWSGLTAWEADASLAAALEPLKTADAGLAPADGARPDADTLRAEPPRKVSLTPVRKGLGRDGQTRAGFAGIDSSMEAPPLAF